MTVAFDPYDYAFQDDPYPTYRRLRDEAPVLHAPDDDLWVVSRHADVFAVLRDDETFSNRMGVSLDASAWHPEAHRVMSFLALDGAEQSRIRRLVSAAFTPRRVRELAPRIEALTEHYLARMLAAAEPGEADWIGDVAGRLPMDVISEMMGVPEADRDEVRRLSDLVAHDEASGTPLTDPVAWVNVGFHHVDRDEDQSPMPVHWQRFQLVPRDFFAQSPAITEARSCINGATDEGVDTRSRPCIATNVIRPSISASTTPIAAGTVLTARPGLWNESRTTWDFAYLWFRDGEPIVDADGAPALGKTYQVTEADAGSRITVKVTASQTGFPSGTAESKPVTVLGVTPPPTPSAGPAATPAAPLIATISTAAVKRVALSRVRSGKARIRIRVTTPAGSATGRVRIAVGGKKAAAVLRDGQARIKLPRLRLRGRYRLVVTYTGAPGVAAVARVVRLVLR